MHIHGNILCRGPRAFGICVSCLIVGIRAQLKRLIIRVKIPWRPWPAAESCPVAKSSPTQRENPYLDTCKTIAAPAISTIITGEKTAPTDHLPKQTKGLGPSINNIPARDGPLAHDSLLNNSRSSEPTPPSGAQGMQPCQSQAPWL